MSILIAELGLSQPHFARWLKVTQPTISRLVLGQPEPGPVSRLLDQLEALLDRDGAAAARAIVLSGAPIALAPPAPASSSCAGDTCPSAAPAAEGAFSGEDFGKARPMAMQQGFGRFG
jgi:hypothetical protein